MTGATQRVKKTFALRGSIAFLNLSVMRQNGWLASEIFTCLVVPHTKQIALAMTEKPQICRFLVINVSLIVQMDSLPIGSKAKRRGLD